MVAFVVANLWACDTACAEDTPTCRVWLATVAQEPDHGPAEKASEKGPAAEMALPGPVSPNPWDLPSLTETDKLDAIQCLLGAEDDLRPARFGGSMRAVRVSQLFAPPRANLAALYMISYIYSGRIDHASVVALRGENASYSDAHQLYVTKAEAVHSAYQAYRLWFAKVRQMGLERARQAGLQPLDGTGLRWY